jgi:branched-subunit amino acid ABC-type transport system permease component
MVPETGALNAIVTGLVTGSIVALGAIGLALVYDIAEVPNFAHGDLLTLGAYLALFVNKPGSVPVFDLVATGQRSVSPLGAGLLFSVTAVGVIGIVYNLGGADALRGGWWGRVDVSGPAAFATHLVTALLVAGLVVVGLPSLLAALLFAVVIAGATVPLLESLIFRKFRDRGAELAMMLIVSLAVAFIVRFGIQTLFGGNIRFYEIETSLPVAGLSLDIIDALYYDFYLQAGGLVVAVLQSQRGEATELLTVGYSWLGLVGVAGAVALGSYVAYTRRGDKGAVIGPALAGALGGLTAGVIGLVVAAGPAVVPTASAVTSRVSASPLRLAVIGIAAVMMGLLHYVLQATTLGKAMRATSDNPDLALIRGIDTRLVLMTVWIIAGVFAAVAGVMVAFLFSNLTINLGFTLLLPMFAGVILGGISVYGAILGSYAVGLAMEVGIFVIPGLSSTYRVSVAFIVLLLVLLVRPEGIGGGS